MANFRDWLAKRDEHFYSEGLADELAAHDAAEAGQQGEQDLKIRMQQNLQPLVDIEKNLMATYGSDSSGFAGLVLLGILGSRTDDMSREVANNILDGQFLNQYLVATSVDAGLIDKAMKKANIRQIIGRISRNGFAPVWGSIYKNIAASPKFQDENAKQNFEKTKQMFDSKKNPRAKTIADTIVNKILELAPKIKEALSKKIAQSNAERQENPFAVFGNR